MALCLLDSIALTGGLHTNDLMNRFHDWRDNGAYTPTGTAFDCGVQVSWALSRSKSGKPAALCGGQKKTEFFSHFGAVILSREGVDTMEHIQSAQALSKNADRLAVVQPPMGMAHISSTAIRAGMREGHIPEEALHPAVLELL